MSKENIYYGKNLNFKNNLKNIITFWIGFIIYTLSFLQTVVSGNVNFKFYNALQIIGLVILIFPAIKLISFKFENAYLKTLFQLYFAWLCIVILRGFIFEYEFLKQMLLNPYSGIFLYFAPLILLFRAKFYTLKIIFKIIPLFGLFSIAYILLLQARLFEIGSVDARGLIEYVYKTLSISCGFMLLTYIYHNKYQNLLSIIAIAFSLFFAIVQARRGLIITSIIILFFFVAIYIYKEKKTSSQFY